ncbi:hypothetical protein HELRODRAFT_66532, partial [Helobdella robusta]|uniref:SAGA-associated factor 11 homolog n=1 Tax=Helobdella robusta TaxID=6412 RepID=T1FYM5_HELRO
EVAMEIIDEMALGLCFEIHRSCKRGLLFLDEMDAESQKLYEIVNIRGVDVFGQTFSAKKQYDCICPNCHRNLAASRFAPHLEKCMGMGGCVSRISSRRFRTNHSVKKESEVESDDNSADNDWTYQGDKSS